MEGQLVETLNFSEIRSIGQRVVQAVNGGQLEGSQSWMQKQIEDAQGEKEREYIERGRYMFVLHYPPVVVLIRP